MKIQFLSKSLKDKLRVTCKLRWGVTCKVSRGFRLQDSRGFSGVYYRNIPGNRKSDFISKTASNQLITTFDQRFTKEIPGAPGSDDRDPNHLTIGIRTLWRSGSEPSDDRDPNHLTTRIRTIWRSGSRSSDGSDPDRQIPGIPGVSRDFTKEIHLGIGNLISLVKPRVTKLSRRLINTLLRKSPGFHGDSRGFPGILGDSRGLSGLY
jgi:hypothetical protein